jgi:conjugal transfer pilus assembly protein TraW
MTDSPHHHARQRLAAFYAAMCVFGMYVLPLDVAAAETEKLGPTRPIAEPDLLEDIYSHLRKKEASGELKRLEKEAIARATRSALEPRPVSGLVRTKEAKRYDFDPSIVADQDIKDHTGRIVVKAGTKANPLDYMPLSRNLLFFDGRDDEQVAYVRHLLSVYKTGVKPIMTGGHIANTSRALNAQMYFDQGGYLTAKFGIGQVPAMVSQEKNAKVLRIDEMIIPEAYLTQAKD